MNRARTVATFFLGSTLSALLLGGCARDNGAKLEATAELISDVESVVQDRPFRVGVRIRMPRDAHIYWINPGDGGLPTRVEWRLPEGLNVGPLQWPAPRRFASDNLVSHGYADEVVLWSEAELASGGQPGGAIEIGARVDWLLCRETCVPGGADLKLILPIVQKAPVASKQAAVIEKHAAQRPREDSAWRFEFEDTGDRLVLYALPSGGDARAMKGWVFIAATDDLTEPAAEQKWQPMGEGWYALRLPKTARRLATGEMLEGVLIRENGVRAEKSQGALAVMARRREM